jgi:hypothetical protein
MPEQPLESPKPPRQPGGIFVFKGAKLGIPEGSFKISMSDSGEPKVEIDFHIGLDMTDKWLSIAELNEAKAIEASKALDLEWPSGNDEAAVPHLESEFFHSIQSVCASAFAIDAFYASIKEHIELPPELIDAWNKNRTSRSARISEVMKRGFIFNEETFQKLKALIAEIFSLRDKAVHPSPEMSKPLYHPRLLIGMPWHFVWFREENARNCYSLALSIISQLILKANPGNSALSEYCTNAQARVSPLLNSWESKYGPLFERNPPTSA